MSADQIAAVIVLAAVLFTAVEHAISGPRRRRAAGRQILKHGTPGAGHTSPRPLVEHYARGTDADALRACTESLLAEPLPADDTPCSAGVAGIFGGFTSSCRNPIVAVATRSDGYAGPQCADHLDDLLATHDMATEPVRVFVRTLTAYETSVWEITERYPCSYLLPFESYLAERQQRGGEL